jgi:hypothetical protein
VKGLPPMIVFLVRLSNWSDGSLRASILNETGAVCRRVT